MAQTFDIRFARSAGLAGLFEAPANEFRWKGAGRLSIDAAGISIAVKRGLLTLFASPSRRIATSKLLHVYREGNALRLEFSTRDSTRAVLPFWVSDRDAAAKIVDLLPTERSVELDDATSAQRKFRFDRRLVVLLIVGAVFGVAVLVIPKYMPPDLTPPADVAATQTVVWPATPEPGAETPALTEIGPPTPVREARESRAVPDYPHTRYADPAGISAPSSTSSERVAGSGEGQQYAEGDSSTRASLAVPVQGVAVAPAKSAGLIWLEQYLLFQAESSALRADYLYARDSYDYIRLEELAERWLQVTSRIVNTEEFGGGEFYPLREQQLAVSRNWRDHLVTLARARRLGGDRLLLAHAEFHLVFAEAVEAQLPRHYRP